MAETTCKPGAVYHVRDFKNYNEANSAADECAKSLPNHEVKQECSSPDGEIQYKSWCKFKVVEKGKSGK